MSHFNTENRYKGLDTVRKDRGGPESRLFDDFTNLPDDFYRTVRAYIIRIAERMGVPADRCEDVAQEALLDALEHNKRPHGQYTLVQLRSWFAMVGYHKAIDARREITRHSCKALEELPLEPMDLRAADRHHREAWIQYITTILERLRKENSESCRLLRQRYLEERKIGELAEESGAAPHEVSVRIHRAMQKVRKWSSSMSSRSDDAP